MSGELSDDELEELERLAAYLERKAAASVVVEAEAIGSTEMSDVEVKEDQCVLYGFDGTVDAVWSVSEPLPDILRRPLSRRPTAAQYDKPTSPVPTFGVANYRRVGERTYERES